MNSEGSQNTSPNQGRRSSSGFMPAFDSLHQQKRGSEDHMARRQSMNDQQVKGGIISQLFHSAVGKTSNK